MQEHELRGSQDVVRYHLETDRGNSEISYEMIEPEMMGPVRLQLNWKQFVFHGGCSFNLKSMSGAGLIAGEREGSGKETYSILHSVSPWGAESEEEFHDEVAFVPMLPGKSNDGNN